MNRIHNALGRPGSLAVDSIEWKNNVPCLKSTSTDPQAKIWKAYFELLFRRFDLLKRFEDNQTELKVHAQTFYNYIYRDNGEMDRKKLLELLIGDPRDNEKLEPDVRDEEKKTIQSVFDYDKLRDYKGFAALIQMLDVNVCPYCGRTFIHTVEKEGNKYIRTNQADHYYPKTVYPWLALSIWNLIPICGPCNNRKGKQEAPILYPYAEEMGDAIRFHTHLVRGIGYLIGARDSEGDFEIALEADSVAAMSEKCRERAENEIKMLGIEELYNTHRGYVCDIFRQRYIFGTPYIDALIASFPEMFHTRDDVRAMLYMKRIDAESIGTAPLDKLTRDINLEIDELTGERL